MLTGCWFGGLASDDAMPDSTLRRPYDHESRSATVEAILLKFCAAEEPPDVALYQRITRALERTLRTSLEGAIPGRLVRVRARWFSFPRKSFYRTSRALPRRLVRAARRDRLCMLPVGIACLPTRLGLCYAGVVPAVCPNNGLQAPHAVLFDHVSSTAGWNLSEAQGAAAVGQGRSLGASTDQRLVVILRGLMEPLPKLGFYFLAHIQTLGRDFATVLGVGLRTRAAQEQAIAHTGGLVKAYVALAASFSGTIDCADDELLTQCVFRDLELCLVQIGNTDAFYALVPFVYGNFRRYFIIYFIMDRFP